MFKPFKSFKTMVGWFDGLNDLNGLNNFNPTTCSFHQLISSTPGFGSRAAELLVTN